MTKRKQRDPVLELLHNIDQALVREMQDSAKNVLSANLPERRYLIEKGIYKGLDKARSLIVKTVKVWQQGEEEDDDNAK